MAKSYDHLCVCVECGQAFDATIANAKYCSSDCRVRVHRRRKAYEKKKTHFAETVMGFASEWRNCPSRRKHYEAMREAIILLQKACNALQDDMAFDDAKGDDFS